MKASSEFIKQLELLYEQYEKEVLSEGLLKPSAAKTYLRHSATFVRWCRNDFKPGVMKARKV